MCDLNCSEYKTLFYITLVKQRIT